MSASHVFSVTVKQLRRTELVMKLKKEQLVGTWGVFFKIIKQINAV